jgi:hypothetical protein
MGCNVSPGARWSTNLPDVFAAQAAEGGSAVTWNRPGGDPMFGLYPGITLMELSQLFSVFPKEAYRVNLPDRSAKSPLLAERQVRKFGMPENGQWFWAQTKMLEAQAGAPGSFAVTWDKDGDGKKAFGLFDSPSDFYEGLALCRNKMKLHGYELIPQNRMCNLIMDVEWVGLHDLEHARIRQIVRRLREGCAERYSYCSKEVEVFTCCSTRETRESGQYKNSYHVVCPQVVPPRLSSCS